MKSVFQDLDQMLIQLKERLIYIIGKLKLRTSNNV